MRVDTAKLAKYVSLSLVNQFNLYHIAFKFKSVFNSLKTNFMLYLLKTHITKAEKEKEFTCLVSLFQVFSCSYPPNKFVNVSMHVFLRFKVVCACRSFARNTKGKKTVHCYTKHIIIIILLKKTALQTVEVL